MFGDLDWPLSASCGFVSISWASCFIFSFVLLLWSLSPSGALSSNVATMIVSHITCAVIMYGHCLRQVHSFSEGSEWVMYLNWILFLKLHKLVHSISRQKKNPECQYLKGRSIVLFWSATGYFYQLPEFRFRRVLDKTSIKPKMLGWRSPTMSIWDSW